MKKPVDRGRRGFMGGVIGASVLAVGGWFPRLAFASPMGVLAAVNGALSVAKMFASKGGGLEAMLGAQVKLLGLVLEKLEDIQVELINVRLEIAKLSESLRVRLADQFRDELLEEINGASTIYNSLLRGSEKNPSLLRTEQVQADLRHIVHTISLRRSTLGHLSNGLGSEVALVLPLMLGVEVSCMAHLGYPPSIILSRLADYEEMITLMRSAAPGSIPGQIAIASQAHDAAIREVEETSLGRTLNVSNFKISASQHAALKNFCHVPFPLRAEPPVVEARHVKGDVSWIYFGSRSLDVKDNGEFGLKLLDFSEMDIVAPREAQRSIGPADNFPCRIHEIPGLPSDMSRSDVLAWGGRIDPALSESQRFAAAVSTINYQRAFIGVCLGANLVLDKTAEQISSYRTVLDSTLEHA